MDVLIGSLSAIPRWRFARALCSEDIDATDNRSTQALSAFYESTSEILDSKNIVVEHLVNRETDAGLVRLMLYGALMRCYLYLAEKNE